MEDAPPGRAFAFLVPERLQRADTEIFVAGGLIYCYDHTERLIFPLEAVCRKVKIPGVRYRQEGDL